MTNVSFLVPVLQADIPTQNGNLYPRQELENALDKLNSRPEQLSVKSQTEGVVGEVRNLRLTDEGTLVATIVTPKAPLLSSVFGEHYNMACIGKVKIKNGVKVVEDLEFQYVSLDSTSAVVYPDSHD